MTDATFVSPAVLTTAAERREQCLWESPESPAAHPAETPPGIMDLQNTRRQQLLFGPNPQALCAEIGLSWSRALDLYRDGFLSFSPALTERLDESQETELRFLGALARNGCDRQMLVRLLRGLSYPYSYDIRQVYYNLEENQWHPLPEKNEDPETVLTDWLDHLVRANDADTLAGIVELAREALSRIRTNPGL
jgi:hypothetical protein